MHYPDSFYEKHQEGSVRSARVIVPMVLELVRPQSVVDVGCGLGAWLSVFGENGVEDFLGFDGSHITRERLIIPQVRFATRDLTKPFSLDRKFDLVVSAEVAEHLPPEAAPGFVASLTELGPVVLFSAAIPYQGGSGHLNEQWPEYWIHLFKQKNFEVIDCLRKALWADESVEPWYAQNIFLFVRNDALENYPALAGAFTAQDNSQIAMVHPKVYLESCQSRELTLSQLPKILASMPALIKRAITNRLPK